MAMIQKSLLASESIHERQEAFVVSARVSPLGSVGMGSKDYYP